ncbi:hypothetical protein A2U01_0070030, partial [Trifolium medium]|nr:hypothetical protein [Trifolium medium]
MEFDIPICSSVLAEYRDGKRMVPPRRGQIKIKIIKMIVAAFSCSSRGKG